MVSRIVCTAAFLAMSLLAIPSLDAGTPASCSLLEETRIGRIEIIGGRFTATRFPFTYRMQQVSPSKKRKDKQAKTQQTMTITVRSGNVTARYSSKRNKRQSTFQLTPGGQARFKETTANKADGFESFEYRQNSKRVLVNIRFADRDVRVSASNLWELLITHRKLADDVLTPAFNRLNRHWRIAHRLHEVETRLFDIAQSDWQPLERRKLRNLINDLSDKKFNIRQRAHRKLNEYGQRIVPFIMTIDPESLDREQRMRVAHLQHELVGKRADLADRVAVWTSGSRAVWISLLNRPKPAQRALAQVHLRKILGHDFPFDPAGERQVRLTQIEQLRTKYDARSIASKRLSLK